MCGCSVHAVAKIDRSELILILSRAGTASLPFSAIHSRDSRSMADTVESYFASNSHSLLHCDEEEHASDLPELLRGGDGMPCPARTADPIQRAADLPATGRDPIRKFAHSGAHQRCARASVVLGSSPYFCLYSLAKCPAFWKPHLRAIDRTPSVRLALSKCSRASDSRTDRRYSPADCPVSRRIAR